MVEENKAEVQHTVTTKEQTESWLTEKEISFHVSLSPQIWKIKTLSVLIVLLK